MGARSVKINLFQNSYPENPKYVSVDRADCGSMTQPEIGAALAEFIKANGLVPKEGWNSSGIPGDILYRGTWYIDDAKFAAGDVRDEDWTYVGDTFLVFCVPAEETL
jgi:hypothetical protein